MLLALLVAVVLVLSLFSLFVVLPLTSPPVSTPPDLILYNGTVLTMEADRPEAEAVAVAGNQIVAVGTDVEVLALRTDQTLTIDLAGRTLLPGFIDSHAHWIGDRDRVGLATAEEAIQTALENGWTSISELFVNQDRLDELRALDAAGELHVRVNAYLPLSWQHERFGTWYQQYEPGQEFSSHLRIGGVKIFVDSWLWGELLFSQSELSELVAEAHEAGFQIASHTTVDESLDLILNAYEDALQGASNELYRHRAEHVVLLRDDQLERMRWLGITASIQLTWFHSNWAEAVETELLPEDVGQVARWHDLLEAGVPTIGGTDFPYGIPATSSALHAIHQAVTRLGDQGIPPPPWMINQRITVEEALRLLTIDAAYGTFQEDVKGSIAVGKLADLVVLGENPLAIPPERIPDVEVLLTIVGGTAEHCLAYTFLCEGSVEPEQGAAFRSILEDVSGATAFRYGARDDQGQVLDTIKIIENPEGGYLGVYHSSIAGTFRVRLATSTDLLRWTFQGTLETRASQPTIAPLPDGGYLVAFEKESEGAHLRFQYYPDLESLLGAVPQRTFDAPQTLSSLEGTPSIYEATMDGGIANSEIVVGFHFFRGALGVDRVATGVLRDFATWTATEEAAYNAELVSRGAQGNIGDRDSGEFRGRAYRLQEVQFAPRDWSSWRVFLYDVPTEAFTPLEIKTRAGSTAFANPTFTLLRSPSGADCVVVTYFLPHEGAKGGEAGQLIFYNEF
ncbi:MAG: amidohydrolase family protein [Thermoplasmata archaeon]